MTCNYARIINFTGVLNVCDKTAACRYQYTLQPTNSLVCNPYTSRRLIIDCEITYSLSEQSANLQWIFVPDSAGSARTLSTDGVKYSISAAPTTGRTRSQLTVSSLGLSDVGRYYCRGAFSNGTLLTRSQELTLFSQAVFDAQRLASCSTFSGQSDRRTTCVLMSGQVAVGVTDPSQNGGTGNGNGGSNNNNGGGDGGGLLDTNTIVLAVVISAIVLFILLAVGLVTCLLLINCACESYNYGVK